MKIDPHAPGVPTYASLGDMFKECVPTFKSRSWKPFVARWNYSADDYEFVHSVSATRCDKRIQSYIIPGELERAKESIRFGVKKEGNGYGKERGDFCLVGASLVNGHLTAFYRKVELIGGLHYDLALFNEVEQAMGRIKTVTIMAAGAFVFALKGNSGEKLHAKLMENYE